jgi:hypothetical protein
MLEFYLYMLKIAGNLGSKGVDCIGLGGPDTPGRLERYKQSVYNSKEYLADMAPDAPGYDGVSNIFFELMNTTLEGGPEAPPL